mmetsp:Transcript_43314/g.44005  ORF Transcript_43314/g.44005 Transcript_43314/m.44005 type:complete len:137 (+) Transcript_43314:358-768(+)
MKIHKDSNLPYRHVLSHHAKLAHDLAVENEWSHTSQYANYSFSPMDNVTFIGYDELGPLPQRVEPEPRSLVMRFNACTATKLGTADTADSTISPSSSRERLIPSNKKSLEPRMRTDLCQRGCRICNTTTTIMTMIL